VAVSCEQDTLPICAGARNRLCHGRIATASFPSRAMKAQKQGREPGGFSFKALAHQKPLALPLVEHEGFRRGELSCLLSLGFDSKSTPRFLMSVTSQLRGFFVCVRIRERDDMACT
jgi:hypothetical protein